MNIQNIKESMIFSDRRKLLQRVIGWCEQNNVPSNNFNIITALNSLGFIDENNVIKDFSEISCINCGTRGECFEFDEEKQGKYCVRCQFRKESI